MGKKQEIVTPQDMLIDILAQLQHQEFKLECLMAGQEITSDRFLPFNKLPAPMLSGYRKRARARLAELALPMFAFVVPGQVKMIEEETPEPVVDPVETRTTEETGQEGDAVIEVIDGELLPECNEDKTFYGQKTTVFA